VIFTGLYPLNIIERINEAKFGRTGGRGQNCQGIARVFSTFGKQKRGRAAMLNWTDFDRLTGGYCIFQKRL
jgi:hypothetical protein